MRIAIVLQYIGTSYFGWQTQINVVSIQSLVEYALSKIADKAIKVVGSSRTDKGVHAYFQVAHFDPVVKRKTVSWISGGNAFLPKDIQLLQAKEVSSDFHARFSAVSRTYRYVLHNSTVNSSFLNGLVSQYPYSIDVEVMNEASKCLIGEHDFSAFRGRGCQSKSPIRTINFCRIRKVLDFIVFDINANSFLYHMVRNIVSGLLLVGNKKKSIDWFRMVLTNKVNGSIPCIVPPSGLYLYDVMYNNDYFNNIEKPYSFINIFD